MMESNTNTVDGLFISGRKILQSIVDDVNEKNKTNTYNNFIDEEAFNKLHQYWHEHASSIFMTSKCNCNNATCIFKGKLNLLGLDALLAGYDNSCFYKNE